ncbi:hypothetical protein PENSPDRAFT_693259 [Peniophora sp. CONT]|nr:hypothetical protein PENSPDRAFT_693259 [Peniophora sp. CONT]
MFTRNRSCRASFNSGFNPHEIDAELFALYVPTDANARLTRVPVTHFALNRGMTIPKWSRFFEGAARARFIHTHNRTYMVVTPADRSRYPVSQTLYEKAGVTRRGPILIFQRAANSRLLVNMNPSGEWARDFIFDKLSDVYADHED